MSLHLLSRMLPAFGLGVMGTFLVCRHSWVISTPLQRAVFGLGALAMLVGLGLDVWLRRAASGTDDRATEAA